MASAVEAYRQMEARLANGSALEKARVYRELAARHGRTSKAWECHMHNIPHILEHAGEPWLPGLRPAAYVEPRIELQLAISSRVLTSPSLSLPNSEPLEREAQAAETSGRLSPTNEVDERRCVLATIVRRRRQPAVMESMLDADNARCAMTGFDEVDARCMAHIRPYSRPSNNAIGEALLLRSCVHSIFDQHLITVGPRSLMISMTPVLRASS